MTQQSKSNAILISMKQLLKRTKGPQYDCPFKRQRSLSEDSTMSCSSSSTEETKVEKRVRIYPMVQVKEIAKYTEDEVEELFYSRNNLRKIREREKVCLLCQSSNPAVYKLFMTAYSLADREDLECKTGIKSFEDMEMRSMARKAVVEAVLEEQTFNRDSLGSWDAVWAPEQCQHYNLLSSVQAVKRAVEAERDAIEIYAEDL